MMHVCECGHTRVMVEVKGQLPGLSFHCEFQGSNLAFLGFVAGSLMHRVTPLALLIFRGRISLNFVILAREGGQQVLGLCLSLLHNVEVMDIHTSPGFYILTFN